MENHTVNTRYECINGCDLRGEPIDPKHFDPALHTVDPKHHAEAMERYGNPSSVHRFGRIAPGENIVLVVTASAHRQAAFEAAEFLMDYLKTNAPFWKQGESTRGTSWIEAQSHDDAAAARWTKS